MGNPMNSKLQATVCNATERTTHTLGILGSNGPETTSELPVAVRVEIVAADDGIFLLRFDKDGEFCGDTWHQSIEEAKEQACFEFNISASDWNTVASL